MPDSNTQMQLESVQSVPLSLDTEERRKVILTWPIGIGGFSYALTLV